MFTGCGDGVVRAYDAKSGALKRHYTGHEGAVNCLVVARDKIFSGSSDASLRVWDAKDLSEDLMLPEDGSGAAVACVGGGNDTLSALARDLETPKEEIEDDPDIVVSASRRFSFLGFRVDYGVAFFVVLLLFKAVVTAAAVARSHRALLFTGRGCDSRRG